MTEKPTPDTHHALSEAAAQAALATLNASIDPSIAQSQTHWQIKDNWLCKTFTFKHFRAAFAFMTECALLAEKANHHPDWSNSYRTVTINLTSHDVNALSQRDFMLAKQIETIVN